MGRQAIAAVIVIACTWVTAHAQSNGDSFRDYPVSNGSAQQIQALLQSQLNQLGVSGRITADPDRNRLIVQGGENVQRFVVDYLARNSASPQGGAQVPAMHPAAGQMPPQAAAQQPQTQLRPQATNFPPNGATGTAYNAGGPNLHQPRGTGPAVSPSGLLTKTYKIAADLLPTTENHLKQRYAQVADVRVASIPESGTLIVVAPATMQEEIAAQIAQAATLPQQHRVIPGGLQPREQQQPTSVFNNQDTQWDLRATEPTQRYQEYAQQARQFEQQARPEQATRPESTGPVVNQSHQYVPQNGQPNVNNATLGHLGVQQDQGRGVDLKSNAAPIINALRQGFGDRISQHAFNGDPAGAIYTIDLGDEYGTVRLDWNTRTNKVVVRGYAQMQERMVRLLLALDNQEALARGQIRFKSLGKADPQTVLQLVSAVQRELSGTASTGPSSYMVGNLFYRRQPQDGAPAAPQNQPGQPQGQGLLQPTPLAGANPQRPVRAEVIEGIGIVLTGTENDLNQLMDLIQQIINESDLSEPLVELFPLRHVDSVALGPVVQGIYDAQYAIRRGPVSITPFANPNSLLLIGQEGAVQAAKELIGRLDQRGSPGAQFRVFPLRYANAITVQTAIQNLFQGQNPDTLEPIVVVIADDRTNTLVVRASQRDLLEVESLIRQLDVTDVGDGFELELRIFPLQNTQAADLIQVLQEIIIGGATGGQQGGFGGGFGGQQALGAAVGQTPASIILGDLRSGILSEVRLTADLTGNTVIVAAPIESMDLIEHLILTLDRPAGISAEIKVFPVLNGDATQLVEMLRTLFGQQATQGGGGGFGGQQQQLVAPPSGGFVPLRFAVDVRTNSILAAGTPNDLLTVEAIITNIDANDVVNRNMFVYRLKNTPAVDIANSITAILQTEADLLGNQTNFQALQNQIVVVPESITNNLIVITPNSQLEDRIIEIIQALDQQPPMVMIQVLIAEVALNNTDEFGVELGLQDSILFDRSLVGDLLTTTNTTQTQTPGGSIVTETQEIIQSATVTPGFLFANPQTPLPNSAGDNARTGTVATQGLTTFSVGRINNELGYGGLVLSASSESVSVLIRALQESRRLDVISRPQIQTLDNQPAFVQVGQRVQLPGTSTFDPDTGQTILGTGAQQNVGIILGVQPRISIGDPKTPLDDQVVMQIDIEKSEVGPEAEGTPISINAQGDVIRTPRINTVTAQTTLNGVDGQTIVLGGLITKSESKVHRRVPLLASIPVLGHLFRYDSKATRKTELMIILTPRILRSPEEEEYLKRVESARMSWVLADVNNIHGGEGLHSRYEPYGEPSMVVYPDLNPDGVLYPENGMPGGPTPLEPIPGGQPTPGNGPMAPMPSAGMNQPPQPPQENFMNFMGNEGGVQQTGYYGNGGYQPTMRGYQPGNRGMQQGSMQQSPMQQG